MMKKMIKNVTIVAVLTAALGTTALGANAVPVDKLFTPVCDASKTATVYFSDENGHCYIVDKKFGVTETTGDIDWDAINSGKKDFEDLFELERTVDKHTKIYYFNGNGLYYIYNTKSGWLEITPEDYEEEPGGHTGPVIVQPTNPDEPEDHEDPEDPEDPDDDDDPIAVDFGKNVKEPAAKTGPAFDYPNVPEEEPIAKTGPAITWPEN